MEIVVAKPEQVDAMVAITEQAQANMAAMGIDQWQCGYPDRSTWEADVAAGAPMLPWTRDGLWLCSATPMSPRPPMRLWKGSG